MTELLKDKYVINIDEAGFSKSVKTQYLWLPIGSDASIINDVFQGRTNLILCVSQFGDWIGIIKRPDSNIAWLRMIYHNACQDLRLSRLWCANSSDSYPRLMHLSIMANCWRGLQLKKIYKFSSYHPITLSLLQ